MAAIRMSLRDGTPIEVRPIQYHELDRIVLRCWPEDRTVIDDLFATQGTIGMAAWEGDCCVGVLHCYALGLPQWTSEHWPAWNKWFAADMAPESAPARDIGIQGAAWGHACCHVGRTVEAKQLHDDPNKRYFGSGIGTALCRASVTWAQDREYVTVVAPGAPAGLFEFAVWTGHLPWTTYLKLGFRPAGPDQQQDELPGWARGNSPPEVMQEVRQALQNGRPAAGFWDRLMVLDLK